MVIEADWFKKPRESNPATKPCCHFQEVLDGT
jgi:hypothetical protein